MGNLMERLRLNSTRFIFILKGLFVGSLVGIVVSIFRFVIEKSLILVKGLYQQMHTQPWLLGVWLVVMLLCCYLCGLLIKSDPNIKGSGIPQVEGQLEGSLEVNWWSVFWKKFVGGILAIGSGLFLGREGPSIQLGAMLGQGVAQVTKQQGTGQRVLLAGGASAGLAAAFNAPIAATLFVLEEVYHNFSPLVWTTALSSALAASWVSSNFFGLDPILDLTASHVFPVQYYPYLILLGLVLGLLGYLYQYLTLNMPSFYQRLNFLKEPYYSVVPFVLVIFVGYFWPQTLGGGNSLIVLTAHSSWTLKVILGYFVLRLLFSTLSYGSGLPGGIFLPILTLGALLGALVFNGLNLWQLMPAYLLVNFIIYAMAGYFAGIGKAPFTAILLVTEMVGSLKHLLPLAVVSLVAYAVVDLLDGEPIYEAMLQKLRPQVKQCVGTYHDRLEVPVFVDSYLQDKQVRDIAWPKECLLVAIRRGESEQLPHGDTVIRSGDTLVFAIAHENRAWLKNEIEKLK